jgi:hypothetical protein
VLTRDPAYGGASSIGMVPYVFTFNLNRQLDSFYNKISKPYLDNIAAYNSFQWYRFTYVYEAFFALFLLYDWLSFFAQYFISKHFVDKVRSGG